MKEEKKWLIVGVIIIICAIIFSVHLNQKLAPKAQSIKISAILPLTGSASEIADQHKRGIEYAIRKLQNNGKQIEVIYEDDGNDPKKAVDAMQKLIYINKVPVVFSVMSAASMAIYPIAESRKVIHFANCGHPTITQLSNWVFRNFPNAAQEAYIIIKFAIDELRIKKLGLLYINDAYGESAKDYIYNTCSSLNFDLIVSEPFDKAGVDYRNVVSKVIGSDPDAIYIFGYGKANALVLNEVRQNNYKGIILGTYNFSTPPTTEISKDLLEGSYFTAPAITVSQNETYLDFIKDFESEMSAKPEWNSVIEFDAINLLIKAWEMVNLEKSFSDSLRATLEGMGDYKGIAGIYSYKEHGEWWVQMSVNTYKKNLEIEVKKTY
ncbi:ABC transporter substrate-binding protein [candidate division KSB1 bacterium]|nr:ABC transporter substrate-binding protein [candidate division KSB1 bacterium]